MFRILIFVLIAAFSSVFAGKKVVLFNDTSAWYHWGCTGTSAALKANIYKLGFEIEAVPINVVYSLQEIPPFEEFDNPERFDCFQSLNTEVLRQIQSSDAVVITGEGTIHDLRAGPRTLLYLAHISKKFLGKHVEIINHSVYPKDDPSLSADFFDYFQIEKEKIEEELLWAQIIYKNFYAELDFVAIREPLSRNAMSQIGISSTLSFDCLPLYIRDYYCKPKQVEKKIVVVAGSVAFTELGAQQLCSYLDKLDQMGYQITILTGAAAFPSRDDEAFVQFLRAHSQASLQLVVASSMEEWLDTINHAAFLVSGRFHHSIAAFCLNTPFIALNSNTHKVHAICSMLGQKPPLLFSDPYLLGHLLARTKEILSAPPVNNHAKIREICQLAERNFEGLRMLLAKQPD
jgi:polysaccharide pyruvyl transferase WcaK-like protein